MYFGLFLVYFKSKCFLVKRTWLHPSDSRYVNFVCGGVFLDVSLIPVSFLSPDILWFSDYHIQQRKISTEPEYFITLPHISSVALLSAAGRFSKCNYLKLSKIS